MTTRYLKLPDGTLAYEEEGSGPLVICVPSMGDLRREYRFLVPQLVEAGYRAVSLDVRGHGESSIDWPDYSVGAIGSDLLALIRHLDSGPARIIGTSMASGAAVWAAAEAPDLIAGLVLVGPFVRGETTWQNRLLYSALFARPWGPALWGRYFSSLFPSRKPDDFKEYSAALRANLTQPGRLEALFQMMLASKAASEQRLERVSAPVKVIMGSRDPDFKQPEGEARWVAEGLNGSYHLLPGAGHYPHVEFPEEAGALILAFLKSIEDEREKAYAA